MYVGLVSGNVLPESALGALVHTTNVRVMLLQAYKGSIADFTCYFEPQKYLMAP
jgi:hypothetical protein